LFPVQALTFETPVTSRGAGEEIKVFLALFLQKKNKPYLLSVKGTLSPTPAAARRRPSNDASSLLA
jgi:hypothetical protein